MNKNKICKECRLEFSTYYYLKKHKLNDCSLNNDDSDHESLENDFPTLIIEELIHSKYTFRCFVPPYCDNDMKDFVKIYIQQMKDTIFNSDLPIIDKNYFFNNPLYKEYYYKIIFDYLFKEYCQDEIIQKYIVRKMNHEFYKINKDNFIQQFNKNDPKKYNEMEQIDLLKSNYQINIQFDEMSLIEDIDEISFYKDYMVFPLIFFKKFNKYFNRLSDYEKLFVDIFYTVKKREYCHNYDDENNFYKNSYYKNFHKNCLLIQQYIQGDKLNSNYSNFNSKILNKPFLQCVLIEQLLLSKFLIYFNELCDLK